MPRGQQLIFNRNQTEGVQNFLLAVRLVFFYSLKYNTFNRILNQRNILIKFSYT